MYLLTETSIQDLGLYGLVRSINVEGEVRPRTESVSVRSSRVEKKVRNKHGTEEKGNI